MGLEQQIIDAVARKEFSAFFDAGMVLIPKYQVSKFLSWLDGKGVLLGAEGFQFDGKSLIPLMECIIDYSHGEPTKSIEFHKKTIAESPEFQKVHFIEFTFGDQPVL